MRNVFLTLLIILTGHSTVIAQADNSLPARVDSILQMTGRLDYEKIMDYTYPKLFTIVSRDEMIKAVKEAFDTDEYTATVDSIKLLKIFPVFTMKEASYAKISHSMIMRMRFKEAIDSSDAPDIVALLEPGFGKGNIRFDNNTSVFSVLMQSELVAIKDEYAKEWSFVNFEKESPLVGLLFSKDVIEKLIAFK